MSYLGFFDLHAEPFAHAPSDKFYYASQQHSEALSRLTHAVRSMQGLALLVGDIGRGKSTLARRLLNALPEDQFEASMLVVVHAAVSADWLLRRIALNLGVTEPADEKLALISQLYQRLITIHESGKRAVVLVDEAQMLATRELMEEFRGLLNLEVPGSKLVTFVFFGLPELEANLRLDPPLAQRVVLKYALKGLQASDTAAYVQHRLLLAGGEDALFPEDALLAVHTHTQGVPRLINTLCDNVLLELFFSRQKVATPALVSTVAHNLNMDASASSVAASAQAPPMFEARATTQTHAVPPSMTFSGNVVPRTLSDEAEDIAHWVAEEPLDEPEVEIPMTFDAAEERIGVRAPASAAPPSRISAAARASVANNLLQEVDDLLAEISKF